PAAPGATSAPGPPALPPPGGARGRPPRRPGLPRRRGSGDEPGGRGPRGGRAGRPASGEDGLRVDPGRPGRLPGEALRGPAEEGADPVEATGRAEEALEQRNRQSVGVTHR